MITAAAQQEPFPLRSSSIHQRPAASSRFFSDLRSALIQGRDRDSFELWLRIKTECSLSLCSSSSLVLRSATFLRDLPDSIYMLNISCICRLVESGSPVSHSQSNPNGVYKGRESQSWWGTIALLFPSSRLCSSVCFWFFFFLEMQQIRLLILEGFFCFVLSCEHVQPEAVLPAQGQRCVQVPSLRRTPNNIPPLSSSPSSPRRRQELFCWKIDFKKVKKQKKYSWEAFVFLFCFYAFCHFQER